MSWRATALACAVSTCTVIAAFSWATEGFSALTAEEARRLMVRREAPPLPPMIIESIEGDVLDWREAFETDGRPTVLHFIYSRCISLCSVQTAQTRDLQRAIGERGLESKVRLVTVSFDPAQDTLPVLARHAERLGAWSAVWSMWRPVSEAELASALRQLGIVVLPDQGGEFVHNAAWLVIDRQGRLREIVPQEQPVKALRIAMELAAASAIEKVGG